MANFATPPGSWGKIPPAKLGADGRWKANGRYKTLAGESIQRFRSGSTGRKAEHALLELFQTMAAEDKAQTEATAIAVKKKRRQKEEIKFADAQPWHRTAFDQGFRSIWPPFLTILLQTRESPGPAMVRGLDDLRIARGDAEIQVDVFRREAGPPSSARDSHR
jgi:hypothetical protein